MIYLLVLSIFDLKTQTVPAYLLIGGCVCVLVFFLIQQMGKAVYDGPMQNVYYSLGGLLPGVILLMVSWVTDKVGRADGLVLSIAGSGLTFFEASVLTCISMVLMSLVAAGLLLIKKVNRNSRLPYIPFLFLGYVLMQVSG